MATAHVLFEVLAASVLAAVLGSAGSRVRRLCRFPVGPGLRLPVDFLLGSWVLAAAVLTLGLVGLWMRGTLLAALAVLAAAGRWHRLGWGWAGALPAALGALVALPAALPPPYFYDALVYHLGLPWQALLEGGLHPHPESVFSSFPPLAQLLAAAPLSVGLVRVPALIHWWSFVAAGAAAGALARALGAPRWGAVLCALSLPLLPGHALVPALPAAEGWALAGVLVAAALVVGRTPKPGAGLLAGLAVGIASASRLQGLTWAFVIVAITVSGSRGRWRTAPHVVIGWIVGSAPWWAKNLVLLHDPFAPVAWRREGMATLWRDAGSLMHASQPGGIVPDLLRGLEPHVAYLAPLLLAALLAVLSVRTGRVRLAGLAALGGLVAWALSGSLPRFLGASIAILAAVAASAARSRAGRWASALSLGVTVLVGLSFSVRQVGELGGLGLLGGSTASVASRWVANDPRPLFAAAASLPESSRVLFVGEPRGFGFPRRFVAPSQHDVSPLRAVLESSKSPSDACRQLQKRGFTHLLVNWGELGRLAGGYPVAPWRDRAGWLRWCGFVAALGRPALEAKGVEVFVLSAEAGS